MPIKCADSAHRGNHPTAGFRLIYCHRMLRHPLTSGNRSGLPGRCDGDVHANLTQRWEPAGIDPLRPVICPLCVGFSFGCRGLRLWLPFWRTPDFRLRRTE
jgi:hypothetical protein